MIVPVREPRAWFASASRFSTRYEDLDVALPLWRRSAEEAIAAKHEKPEQVLIVGF